MKSQYYTITFILNSPMKESDLIHKRCSFLYKYTLISISSTVIVFDCLQDNCILRRINPEPRILTSNFLISEYVQ